MKDIRSLYESAKYNGRSTDVSAYVEAVDHLLESNPRDFLSSAEYIISSGYGAQKFISFIENYGLPIMVYDDITALTEGFIERGQAMGKPVTEQIQLMNYLESFKEKYPNCFMMVESIINDDYFEEKSNGKLNVAYRAAVDKATGHPIKIIYSLKGATVTDRKSVV